MLRGKHSEAQMADFVNLANHLATALQTAPEDPTVSRVVEGEMAFLDYVTRSHLLTPRRNSRAITIAILSG